MSLTLAVVASSPAPLLLLDGQLTVIAASVSFCDQFDISPADLSGQTLYSLGTGEWDMPEIRALMISTVSDDEFAGDREMEFERPQRSTRRLIVEARRLAYLDLAQTRILIAVSDVTNARADAALKDDALRHITVLLQEVRHRVANSLQIVASVLLQNARKTDSDETRGNLQDAHQRVMSVAALERMLSNSDDGDVAVHAYFTSLCDNITGSLIDGLARTFLTVEGGDGVVEARVAVSLGLIVTELVINALKYAFPDGRPGRITVDYNFHGPNWVLCVRDDGVGMPPAGEVRRGLGSSIIQALARQLSASVEVVQEHPGTKVSIHHAQIALVREDVETEAELLATKQAAPSALSS